MTAPGRSNCLLWALLLYLRRRAKGRQGYIMLRRSRWGAFPHALYAEARPYVPRDPRIKACPPPCFTGRGKWGDL